MVVHENTWRVPVHVDDIPEGGRHFDLRADEPTRAALASAAGVPGLDQLEAHLDVRRHGRAGLRVTGALSAIVRQTCVVTLEPMVSDVEEAIDVVFAPTDDAASRFVVEEHGGGAVPASEPPEPLVGDTIDLGAIVAEFLVLGIDPYPRKPGAVFGPPDPAETGAHPFAALAALKQSDRKGG